MRLKGAARKRNILAAGSLAAAAVLGAAPAAHAVDDTANLYSAEACKVPGASGFKFHIFFQSGQNGSYRNIGYAVYNFDDVPDGVAGARTPLTFCEKVGASGAWPGSGLRIKNNAASGENEHYKYMARVYFNSGYKGAQDVMAPYQHIDRFRHVYNQNASFQFTG
ncbi:hypothetical protein [Streptomyces sp. NPDC017529]|uniref:hypothetical protein n=1 Tax=Streptomyces sp. NPDC017529 TaxID=3365000 RepID=UPI003787F0FC